MAHLTVTLYYMYTLFHILINCMFRLDYLGFPFRAAVWYALDVRNVRTMQHYETEGAAESTLRRCPAGAATFSSFCW